MKDRPILFNAEMVRAVTDGRKTQTRRICKADATTSGFWVPSIESHTRRHYANEAHLRKGVLDDFVPYGQPGDRLWVRESFWIVDQPGMGDIPCLLYENEIYDYQIDRHTPIRQSAVDMKFGHHPSIHMPRWASRITLEITDVRVERVQDITPADCEDEGITGETKASPCRGQPYEEYLNGDGLVYTEPRHAFEALWDSINANRKDKDGKLLPYSWHDNPWVFVISLKRATSTPRAALK